MKIKLLFLLFLIGLVLLFNSSWSFAAKGDESLSVKRILNRIDLFKTYHVLLTAKIYPPDAPLMDPNSVAEFDPMNFMEHKTTVYGESGKKLKILSTFNMLELKKEITSMLLFDGTWLWVEQKMNRLAEENVSNTPQISAIKIKIDKVSPDPINEPFNTIYGASGNGLFRYKDLPGTFNDIFATYDLKQESNETGEIVFAGNIVLDENKNTQNSAGTEEEKMKRELDDLMKQSTQFCKVWVEPNSYLIKAYSLGKSPERPTMHVDIEYISVNEELPADTFKYVQPEGVQVQDATESILQKSKMMN